MDKTLLVTLDYPPMVGGVANYYQNLVSYLPEGDIFVLDNSENELLFVGGPWWPKWLKGFVNTWRAISRYDVKHVVVGQVLPVGTIVWLISLVRRIPYTVMTHAMDVTIPYAPDVTTRKRWLMGKILLRAKWVITVSAYTRQHLIKLGVPEDKIEVIYPCPNVSGDFLWNSEDDVQFMIGKYELKDKLVILSVGRLVERKGFDMVIRALPQVLAEAPETVYVVVGEGGDRERLRLIAEAEGVSNSVRFVGLVSDKELAGWYQQCDLFVMPSRELSNRDVEGFGITFIEAGSFGKPVIGGISGGIADAVVDGETGFLVESTNVDMLAEAMLQLLKDPVRAHELGEAGRSRVASKFKWSVQAKHLADLIGTSS
ncbi:MAG: hypothetical protein COW24_02720 [Candidatus Kerfeldbacteria bacterium CG15_BIG_FIL_POST_REV_8_21_14_020_45_12]|uniref:Glycosyltransferase family 1 protein n=1 Tax=Candidatus Kerfeldbacteria bacterium CG15_BIG_FIL_POST_REV_8_21_14_020_45_12 TaxID=2014247 RepID=A0A2M7H3Y9_9BACT|nr:MAG: hypothetical protein COW24_02720 [Candidatus Kerfeldbacteria bacterium CG15_BIG_FIL_POST_REV_8_21_14_020_45_12]PJA93047.1 MAG: hypothetical protein CO132_04805 [Candidatus Kerfeldbacteria bacterium CG_4_9_14_3_um_filter_45_8]